MQHLKTHWGAKGVATAHSSNTAKSERACVRVPALEIMFDDSDARRLCDAINDLLNDARIDGASVYPGPDFELWNPDEET